MISTFYSISYRDELGKGASGQVYMGMRTADKTPCAVKVMFKKNMTPSSVRSVASEIRTLKNLNHENIVKLYDMYEDRISFYLCMELVCGGELFERLEQKTSYEELEARGVCKQILAAVKHCHDHHIVHRDLKPENFMMVSRNDDAAIKLVDFGFAEEARDNNLAGKLGTPMYMAPELWLEQPHGKPVDMWSVGVIIYIILCGYPPFNDERRDRLVKRIVKGVYAYHDEYWTNISTEAKGLITKLLNVDPVLRLSIDDAIVDPWVWLKRCFMVV
jgi:calcium/calmodulin-dependent protein kinase I